MKMLELSLKFQRSLFLRVKYFSIGSHNGLAPTRQQAIIKINDGKFTDAYVSLGLNELIVNPIPYNYLSASYVKKYVTICSEYYVE